MTIYDVVILGSGPAGCCAAIYAARANLNVLMLAGPDSGGQLAKASEVANFPGFSAINGADLMEKMLNQVTSLKVEVVYDAAKSLDLTASPITVATAKQTYQAKTLLLATGSHSKMLNLANEAKLLGHGLSTCATCDGPLFKGRKVAIVGGGDTMASSASYMLSLASEVHIIHHSDTFRAVQLPKAKEPQKLFFHTFKEVAGYVGEDHLTALQLKDVKTNALETLAVDGCFLNIGYVPNNELFNTLKLASDGRIEVDSSGNTSAPNVFAAGDVVANMPRQAVVAASSGCIAALALSKHLREASHA